MSQREKKGIYRLLAGLCVLLAALTVGAAVLCFLLYFDREELKVQVQHQEEQLQQAEEVQMTLRAELEEKNQACLVAREEADALQQAAAEAVAASETMVSSEPGVDEREPGTLVDQTLVEADPAAWFTSREILPGDEVYNRINGRSYQENPNISLEELRYLKLVHYNFSHQVQVGEMIVNAAIAEDVMEIFLELYRIGYEVQSIYLIDNYWTGDGNTTDNVSIEENNTSAFNYRPVTSGGSLSNHAYGRSIDINPQQNPYLWLSNGQWHWSHSNADPYIDRTTGDPHMIVKGDACYNIFISHGFTWGGEWTNPIDYQHFDKLS